MASVHDVAKLARVSSVTISRYLNQPDKVAEKTANRIKRAFAELNFVPVRRKSRRRKIEAAATAAAPKQGTRRIGMVIAMNEGFTDIMAMPLLPLVVGGVLEEASRRGEFIGVVHLDDAKGMRRLLAPGYVDGIVFFGANQFVAMAPDELDAFRRQVHDIPHVHCFYSSDLPLLDCARIGYNADPIGTMAADYLYARGHRQVVAFNDRPNAGTFAMRALKFRLRAVELGMDCTVIETPRDVWTPATAAMRPIVDAVRAREWPARTGAFFCSDEILRTVTTALMQAGIPADRFDMIGCDHDRRILSMFSPAPASIDLHMDEIGRESVRQLFLPTPSQHRGAYAIMLPPTLVEPGADGEMA